LPAGEHSIPIGPNVVNTLREWKLVCPKGDLDLVFPNNRGKQWDHVHIVENFLQPTSSEGRVSWMPMARPNIRASMLYGTSMRLIVINRRKDGGLELPIKTVQERMGHASITITSDVYGPSLSAHRRRQGDGRSMRRCCSL
jgi:integrase